MSKRSGSPRQARVVHNSKTRGLYSHHLEWGRSFGRLIIPAPMYLDGTAADFEAAWKRAAASAEAIVLEPPRRRVWPIRCGHAVARHARSFWDALCDLVAEMSAR